MNIYLNNISLITQMCTCTSKSGQWQSQMETFVV